MTVRREGSALPQEVSTLGLQAAAAHFLANPAVLGLDAEVGVQQVVVVQRIALRVDGATDQAQQHRLGLLVERAPHWVQRLGHVRTEQAGDPLGKGVAFGGPPPPAGEAYPEGFATFWRQLGEQRDLGVTHLSEDGGQGEDALCEVFAIGDWNRHGVLRGVDWIMKSELKRDSPGWQVDQI